MNYKWISIKEQGLPEYEGYYWVTINEVNDWFRNVIKLYYIPSDSPNYGEHSWFYDDECNDECDDRIIAYIEEIIPQPYQGE